MQTGPHPQLLSQPPGAGSLASQARQSPLAQNWERGTGGEGLVRVLDEAGALIAIGRWEGGMIAPVKVLAGADATD
jgi:hypothetical protein